MKIKEKIELEIRMRQRGIPNDMTASRGVDVFVSREVLMREVDNFFNRMVRKYAYAKENVGDAADIV